MIQGILFDKDGTLLDFNKTWLTPYLDAADYLAASVGRPELAEEMMRDGGYIAETQGWVADSLLASGSNQQVIDFWSSKLGITVEGERLTEVRQIFARAKDHFALVLDDMPGFLQEMKDRGIKLGVATMDDERNARGMLDHLGLSEYFDFVCGADSGYGVKPEPGMVLGFCEQCGLTPEEVMMVGDSPRDVNMGTNAGAGMTVGVLTGAHQREELSRHAQYVLDIKILTKPKVI